MAYRESDMLPVVLCRYLSLTVSVGGLFAIQQGQPKSNRINDEVITNSPTVNSWRFFVFSLGDVMKRILLFLSALFIATTAIAETVSIKWQHGNTTYSQSTCTVGDNLDVPTSHPTKYGYDFVGWRAKAARELEYLTVLRGAYIDTGIIYDTDEIEFDIKFEDKTNDSYGTTIFGVGGLHYDFKGTYNGYGLVIHKKNTIVMGTHGETSIKFPMETYSEPHTCNFKIASGIVSGNCDNADKKSVGGTHPTNTGNIFLGGLNKNAESYPSVSVTWERIRMKGDIYYFKIKKDGVLVRDFIPASDTDGVVCFYDKVTKQFFYNAGGANFVAGPIKE